jgi:hypothetical protein
MIHWWTLFESGYPLCCQNHARNYFMIVWDLGKEYEASFKIGIN